MHLSKIPSGLRYYTGEVARLRRAIEDCAISVFTERSYEEIITPAVDYYELFEKGMGAEAHSAFRFADSDGRMLALRPEVTSTLPGRATLMMLPRAGAPTCVHHCRQIGRRCGLRRPSLFRTIRNNQPPA